MRIDDTTRTSRWSCLLAAALAMLACGAGCAGGTPGQKAGCQSHSECDTGKVCGAEDTCIEVACDQCEGLDGVTCHPELDTCTAIECDSTADCDGSKQCIEGVCTDQECSTNDDCPGPEICNTFNRCVTPRSSGPPDVGPPGPPPPADTGTGADAASDTSVDTEEDTAPSGEETGVQEDTSSPGEDVGPGSDADTPSADAGPCGGCGPQKTCTPVTRTCKCDNRNQPKQDMCPPSSGSDKTRWSSDRCACVECTSNKQCSGTETCNNGTCACKSCGAGQSGTCSGSTPFCASGCCVECVNDSDCPGSALCVDNACQQQNGCTQGSCPQGYTCNNNTCEPKQTGSNCTSNQDCPSGQVCKPTGPRSAKCVRPANPGGNCGACNKTSSGACTCQGNLTCKSTAVGLACSNCANSLAAQIGINTDHKCPSGQTCLPAGSLGGSGGGGRGGGGPLQFILSLASPDKDNFCLPQGNSGSSP